MSNIVALSGARSYSPLMNTTNRTAKDLKIACIDESLRDAQRQMGEAVSKSKKNAMALRLTALLQEREEVL